MNINDLLDGDQHALSIFLDFAKVFDTVNNSLLLTKLKYYGFSTQTGNPCASYLSGRRLECIDNSRDLCSDTI